MNNTKAATSLIDRIAAAQEPSRELDARIAYAICDPSVRTDKPLEQWLADGDGKDCWPYTFNLHTALSLARTHKEYKDALYECSAAADDVRFIGGPIGAPVTWPSIRAALVYLLKVREAEQGTAP